MGIIVLDTLYSPVEITNAYVNIDPILTIKRKKSNKSPRVISYDITAHYCCYKQFESDEKPFHKVEITLIDIEDLNNLYGKLYELVKADFINTTDVIDL